MRRRIPMMDREPIDTVIPRPPTPIRRRPLPIVPPAPIRPGLIPIKPPVRRPIPPISIGGPGGGRPINIVQPVPSPIDIKLPSPIRGVPLEPLPMPGGPRPVGIQPIPRPIQPIDIPAPILPDPRDSIDRTLPPLAPPPPDRVRPIPLQDVGYGPGVMPPPPGSSDIQIRPVISTIGGPMPDPRAGRPRGPIVGGMVPGGGGIDYGGGEGPPLLSDLSPELRPIEQPPSNDVERFLSKPFVPPQQPPRVPLSERTDIYGAGKRFDPANLPEGYSFQDTSGMMRTTVMPPAGFVYAYGPDGDRISVPSGEPGAAEMRERGPRSIFNPNIGEEPIISIPEDVFGDRERQVFLPPIKSIDEPVPTPDAGLPIRIPDPVTQPPLVPIADPIVEPDPTPDAGIVPPPPDPTTPDLVVDPEPTPTVEPEPTPTEPMQPINVSNQDPFAASVTQQQVGLDPLTEQLLFGIGGQGGFIPGAMRAAEKVFYDDQGNPVVIDEQVAGFSPDQLQAMQMQRQALGIQNPFLQGAGQAFGAGTQALEEGLQRGRTAAIGALQATRGGVGSLQTGLGESADILRGTLGGYDPSMTRQFYDPFEDRVVQQTIEDIMEQGARSDIGARASDIARGGESAFGSRARLGASERQEALGRGLAEALGGIRSRGFQQAQQTGLGEFARQKAAERAASSGLASLAGQGFGGSQALAGALSGLGQTEQDIGQQRFSGQFGLGTSLQGLGAQAAGASASDIAALYGMGSQQQQQAQQMLDAQRRNLQQRQMTPLLQYQALAPFVSMAPAGRFQTTTQFAPPPSAMQSGLSTGLAAFGALGKLYGGS